MKYLLLSLFAMGGISAVSAQPLVLPLYSDGSVTEIADGGEWEPEIHVYLPENPNGQAVVVCPGGGYKGLSFSPEGIAVAKWLNQRGVAGYCPSLSDAPGPLFRSCRRCRCGHADDPRPCR